MNNEQLPIKRILEIIKLLLALLPVGFLFTMFTDSLVKMFNWDVHINIWILLTVWTFSAWGFVKNRIEGGNDWDRVKILWVCIFYGFMGVALSFWFLNMLLQWTLHIDILEFDRFYYLMCIIWIGWIIGVYFFIFKGQKNK